MPKTSLKSIGKEITKAKTILIASHINPDFDAVGSSVGLYLILKKLNKNAGFWLISAQSSIILVIYKKIEIKLVIN